MNSINILGEPGLLYTIECNLETRNADAYGQFKSGIVQDDRLSRLWDLYAEQNPGAGAAELFISGTNNPEDCRLFSIEPSCREPGLFIIEQ